MRVKIFIDFWNFQISWNKFHSLEDNEERIKIPWDEKLPDALTRLVHSSATYVGTHVYASFDPKKKADRNLKRFLKIMDGFPGYKVTIKERKPASDIRCPNEECKKAITECPHCHEEIKRTVEKGVDTALTVDLIKFAIDDRYDRAILLSADRDFIGAVEFVQERMKRISHVWFRNHGHDLRNACWNHFFIEDIMGQLVRNEGDIVSK